MEQDLAPPLLFLGEGGVFLDVCTAHDAAAAVQEIFAQALDREGVQGAIARFN